MHNFFYFDKLLKNINNGLTKSLLLNEFIHPLSGYNLCDHYVGNEKEQHNSFIPLKIEKNNLLETNDLRHVKENDKVYVEVNFFDHFFDNIFPYLKNKIVLITGQWYGPQIYQSAKTDKLIKSDKILLWVSQNPIYVNIKKYIPIPYGVAPFAVDIYANTLLKNLFVEKKYHITHLPVNPETNECRKKFKFLPFIEIPEFYQKLSETKYIMSPIGDRNDCYRHTEAIGLNVIPISNVSPQYMQFFQSNMYYANIDEMLKILESNKLLKNFNGYANRDFICLNYHRDIIETKIKELLTK